MANASAPSPITGTDFNGVAPRLLSARKDQAIFHQGDRAEGLYRVESGCVRLQMLEYSGYRRVVTFLFPKDLFCAGFTTCWASAHAITDSVLAFYPLAQVWEAVGREPAAAMSLLTAFDKMLSEIAHQLVLAHASADLRLEWFLDWLSARGAREQGSHLIRLPMGRRDIADHLGVAPETVSRMFSLLERRGELHREGRRPAVFIRRPIRAANRFPRRGA